MKNFRLFVVLVFAITISANANDENKKDKVKDLEFEDVKVLPATSVKNQYRSGTCWSFSGLSFLESELLRLNKSEVDLSEMFIVWHTYSDKAVKHVRLHGNLNFAAGGAFHDVTNMIRKYGIVPEDVYDGLNYGEEKHVHGEMDRVLKQHVDAVVENKNKKLTTVWHESMEATLDSYLGEIPQKFEYDGNEYSPLSFANDYLGLDMDNYVEISSYSHHPFYEKFILEVPDNWSWDEMYNVPINEFQEIIDNSLENGFTVAWAADVSEKGFLTSNKGLAVLPEINYEEMSDSEISKWEKLSEKDKEKEILKLDKPFKEKEVTQEMRQAAFDNFQTTDDHGMHIVGMSVDQYGKAYYKVKNSWGEYNKYKGYFYVSKPYVNYKSTCIMVHKDAIPQNIKDKLKL